MTKLPSPASLMPDRLTQRHVATAMLVVATLVATYMGYEYGGYFVGAWGLAVFVLAAVVIFCSIFRFAGMSRSWWSMAAAALFTGYTSWTLFSVFWSPNRGDAWAGAGLTILYLLAFWATIVLVSSGASRRWGLAASAIGPFSVAILTVLMIPTNLDDFFLTDRLMGTVGYFNGEAAFLLAPFWAAIYIAGSRRVNPFVRALVLTGAVFVSQVAVLTQSRGALIAFVLSAVVYFLLSGQRLRGLISLVPVAIALAISFPALNDVYQEFRSDGSPVAALDGALPLIWLTSVGAGIYGLIFAFTDRYWRPGRLLVRASGIVVIVVCAVLVMVGTATFVDRVGSPVAWGQERWEDFRTNERSDRDVSRFLSAGGSGRNVLWVVAWEDFQENPLLGVGTHNYEATYYQDRSEVAGYIRQPHMLAVEVLAERGIVGGVLFFGFLGICVAAGLYNRFRSLNNEGKAQVGAMLAALAYWFVHSSAEWFWQIPAVTLPAMIYLAMLAAPWTRRRSSVASNPDLSLRASGAAIAIIALVVVTPLYVSNLYLRSSERTDNPWVALDRLEQAQLYNPVDPQLARREAELAEQIGDFPLATQAYAQEINLNSEHFAPYFMLARLYESNGRPERALELYREAQGLNPLDTDIRRSVERLEENRETDRQ